MSIVTVMRACQLANRQTVARPMLQTSCDQPSLASVDGQHAEQTATIAFANRQQESFDMKRIALSCAAGAFALVCASAFAQDNPPSSATGLQAGDNAQTTTQGSGMSHKHSHTKKKSHSSHSSSNSGSTAGQSDTPTPGGPGAPVSASGSGQ
jgi:hypothetical protein